MVGDLYHTIPISSDDVYVIKCVAKVVHFAIQAPHLANVLIDILGTKVDIGPSQIRTLVAVATILEMGDSDWSKLYKSLKSHAIMDII